MNSFELFKSWRAHLNLPLPEPDADGLSSLALGDTLLLHVLSNPAPLTEAADDLFVYLPLANTRGILEQVKEEVFWLLAEWNLPGGLPAGVKVGLERKTGLLWLSMRLRPKLPDAAELDAYLRNFVACALARKAQLDDLLRGQAPAGTSSVPPVPLVQPAPVDSRNLTDAELLARLRQGLPQRI
jgi:hypothetical protein